MLIFGHIGLTAGLTKASALMINSGSAPNRAQSSSLNVVSSLNTCLTAIDYRFVIIGALLPDLIDKPIFLLLRSNIAISGRDFGHSLLFHLILLITGIILFRQKQTWFLILGISSFVHLLFDQMWNNPVTLAWPFLGPFVSGDTTTWVVEIWAGLLSPWVFIPEILGVLVLAVMVRRLVMSGKFYGFLKTGKVG